MSDDAANPIASPHNTLVGQGQCTANFGHDVHNILMQLPLPGVIIFVHGVNSDGEWFDQAEKGLCAGLNTRLARGDEQLVHSGTEAGQLKPAEYFDEIDANGFLNPGRNSKSFIKSDDTFSPVIRFRYGYKASTEELQTYGKGIYLNEEDYWGGGPFANGCTTLPDLWGEGLSDDLFLWLHVQHMNPTPDRQVYSCPPRPYYVMAAYRLAKLVESIRRLQADVPITIICHSQGNMIGICAAFLGDRLDDAVDPCGNKGHCVADTYLLCNAPYSLVAGNFMESWSERGMADSKGRTGRQTGASRIQTLAAFFDIMRQRASCRQDDARIDERMKNEKFGFNAKLDRETYGLKDKDPNGDGNASTHGRVTLYCNPHDQVISSTTVQGIGWRGLSDAEIKATDGGKDSPRPVFTQRVFAQGFKVGDESCRQYGYWADQYNKPNGGKQFWFPESPPARYSLAKGVRANENPIGVILTVLTSPLIYLFLGAVNSRINALPPEGWSLTLAAPKLPSPFSPVAMRFDQPCEKFDQDMDPAGEQRDKNRQRDADDPYADDPVTKPAGRTDAAQGNAASEASMRYEHHAELRMEARREGRSEKDTEAERCGGSATKDYKSWRDKKIKTILTRNIDTHATDHSTIVTNPMHAEKAMAYDVAIGNCDIREVDLHRIRIAADWRLLAELKDKDPHKTFSGYFSSGKFDNKSIYTWANDAGSAVSMPTKIVDERTFPAPRDSEAR